MRLLPRQREYAIAAASGKRVVANWGPGGGKSTAMRAARLLVAVRRGMTVPLPAYDARNPFLADWYEVA